MPVGANKAIRHLRTKIQQRSKDNVSFHAVSNQPTTTIAEHVFQLLFVQHHSSTIWVLCGFLLDLSQTANSRAHRNGRCRWQSVGPTSNYLTAGSAFPNSHAFSLDRVLTAKGTTVGAVLRNLNLFHQLSEGATVTCTILSGDSDFLSSLTHIFKLYLYTTICESKVKAARTELQEHGRRTGGDHCCV